MFSVLALSHSEGQIVKSNSEVKFGFKGKFIHLYFVDLYFITQSVQHKLLMKMKVVEGLLNI